MTESLRTQVFSGLLWSVVRVWGNRLGGLLIFFILARLLSPAEFGIYSAVWAILLFLEVFTEQGLADAIVQAKQIESEQLNSVFLVNLFASLALFTGVIFLAPSVAGWMAMPAIELPLQVASISIVLNAMGFCQLAMYRRKFQYRWLAVRSLIATIISGGIGIAMAMHDYGVWALITQYIVAALINLLMLWIKPIWRPGLNCSARGLVQLLRFSLKLMLSRILEASNVRAFELAIGAWMGAATLGLYSIGSRVHQIVIQLLSSVVLDVGLSGFSRLANDKPRFIDVYYKAITATTALAMPVFILLAAVAPEFCVAVFGMQWQASGPILQWLAILGAVQSIQYINGAAITALGYSGKTLLITCAKTLATLTVLFKYGHGELLPLVKAFVYGQLLVSPISLIIGKKQIGFKWLSLYKLIWPYLIAISLAYFSISEARPNVSIENVWLRMGFLVSIGGIVYIALTTLMAFNSLAFALKALQRNSKTIGSK